MTTSNSSEPTGALPGSLAVNTNVESLTERVYVALREAIVSKRLAPGETVTEAKLAAQLGISKTPVREALLKLRESRLVEPNGRRGLRIVQPSIDAVRDAVQIREGLEGIAARLAAERADSNQRDRILKAAQASYQGDAPIAHDDKSDWDWHFHDLVSAAAGNEHLRQMIADVRAFTETLQRRDVHFDNTRMRATELHLEVAAAISEGRADQAEDAMRRHFVEMREKL
jgi:DNA-binding GntR family transcriptional regulator